MSRLSVDVVIMIHECRWRRYIYRHYGDDYRLAHQIVHLKLLHQIESCVLV